MKLFFVAGEASGDLHAGNLAAAVLRKSPGASMIGFGGGHMRRSGVDVRFDLTSLAVVGFAEVLGKLVQVGKAMKYAREAVRSERPDALILVDYPGFNLHLANYAHKLGIPVIYYIAPQVWAWHRSRVKKIVKRVDMLLVVFAFEVEFFARYGINATFVGHPLLDTMVPGDAGDKGPGRRVGLLPGSRSGEVERLLPVMLRAAEILRGEAGDFTFEVACADTVSEQRVTELVRACDVPVEIARGSAGAVISRADAVMVASGTATLESCILGVPMVVLYKVSPVSYLVAKRLVDVPYMSLVNLIAGEAVVPELAQADAVPEKAAECVRRILQDAEADKIKRKLGEIRSRLGEPGASDRAAEQIIGFIQ